MRLSLVDGSAVVAVDHFLAVNAQVLQQRDDVGERWGIWNGI